MSVYEIQFQIILLKFKGIIQIQYPVAQISAHTLTFSLIAKKLTILHFLFLFFNRLFLLLILSYIHQVFKVGFVSWVEFFFNCLVFISLVEVLKKKTLGDFFLDNLESASSPPDCDCATAWSVLLLGGAKRL